MFTGEGAGADGANADVAGMANAGGILSAGGVGNVLIFLPTQYERWINFASAESRLHASREEQIPRNAITLTAPILILKRISPV